MKYNTPYYGVINVCTLSSLNIKIIPTAHDAELNDITNNKIKLFLTSFYDVQIIRYILMTQSLSNPLPPG